MNDNEEKIYIRGQRKVWAELHERAGVELGYASDAGDIGKLQRMISERERAIGWLNIICDHLGMEQQLERGGNVLGVLEAIADRTAVKDPR